mgnify:CR=1 FL=1
MLKKKTLKVIVAMSPYKSLRDSTGQAGGDKRRRVVVAMSGGVDSSVAAALLKKQGFEVEGVFMRFWKAPGKRDNLCCSAEAERAARAVAEKLKIPFLVLDFSKEFKRMVVDYFLSEQKKGRTPNPCVVCNKRVKFGLLFDHAKKVKADFLASGHYAKIIRSRDGESKIFAAKDKQKDQTYFLWGLNQKKLAKMVFPLAGMEKDEVRRLAKKWRLPFWQAESFDLCFAPEGGENFIEKYLDQKPGLIKNIRGEILGKHRGLAFYTIGQRKRLDFPRGPWRVVKKNEKKNEIFVSNQPKDLFSKELILEKVNWLAGESPAWPFSAKVKIRFKSEAADAVIKPVIARSPTFGGTTKQSRNFTAVRGIASPRRGGARNDNLKIVFKKPQFAPTPGQSAVFYSKRGEMLGGGVIKKVYPERSLS